MSEIAPADPAAVVEWIRAAVGGADVQEAAGDWFLFFDPQDGRPVDRRFPFATVITADRHDAYSKLDRPGVFRVNVGVEKATFLELFGGVTFNSDGEPQGFKFTAADEFFPHPVYGRMYWLSVLNPAERTSTQLRSFLIEAHAVAGRRRAKG